MPPFRLRRKPRFKVKADELERAQLQLNRLLKAIEPLNHAADENIEGFIRAGSDIYAKNFAGYEPLFAAPGIQLDWSHLMQIVQVAAEIADERGGSKMTHESGTSESMLTAMKAGEELAALRAEKKFQYEVVVTAWLKKLEGGKDWVEWSRPVDFAITPTWHYHRIEGGNFVDGRHYLVHVYVDEPIDKEEAAYMLMSLSGFMFKGISRAPFAPSDPLKDDDLWDRERLGEPMRKDYYEDDDFNY